MSGVSAISPPTILRRIWLFRRGTFITTSATSRTSFTRSSRNTKSWCYRFFHRDLEYLLDSDQRLRKDYREFTNRCLVSISRIFEKLAEAGIVEPQQEDLRSAMSLNVWLVITNWMAFLKTAHAEEASASLTLTELKQGIYQALTLEIPYLTPAYRDRVMALREKYRPALHDRDSLGVGEALCR